MSISRRNLLTTAGAVVVSGLLDTRLAYAQQSRAWIPLRRLSKIYASQHRSEWCWAACISMLFGYYRHPLSQEDIVESAYGSAQNMGAGLSTLISALNGDWTDAGDNAFTVSIDSMFAPEIGDVSLDNNELIQALTDDNPVLYCTTQHAMILTSMTYIPTPLGPRVIEGWVMDPWPGNGLRRLSVPEMIPSIQGGTLRLAATISIT